MSVLTAIAHVLPPPRYITFPSVGLDVSDKSLKFVKLSYTPLRPNTIRLAKWGDLKMPEGAVVNGVIQTPEAVSALLTDVRKQCKVEHVRIALPEERAYIFETAVPFDVPIKDIRGTLEFKLEENVPLSARDAFFDFDIVSENQEEGVRNVVVTVYGKETILAYEEICKKAGFTPISYEVEAQAISRAIVPKGNMGTCMVVDFGKTRTGIGIVHNEALMYTSTIDIGGDELSRVMEDRLGDLGEDEFTALKNEHGLIGGYKNELLLKELQGVVDRIASEIQARIEYWDAREAAKGEERGVQKIILSGGGVNMAGFPEYLEEKLKLPAVRAAVWQNIAVFKKSVPPILERYAYGYATALGLALADVTELAP
jgi:type IV pilus assembly protein PilM